jgi:hypothetical protein
MPQHWVPRLSKVADVLTIAAAAAFVGQIANLYFPPKRSPRNSTELLRVGEKVPLPFDSSKPQRSVLLVLSRTCRYCSVSASFYQSLEPLVARAGLAWTAVLPQEPKESQAYLTRLGLHVQHVLSGSPRDLRLPGVPAVLLVDEKGSVERTWLGKLTADQENDIRLYVSSIANNRTAQLAPRPAGAGH